MRSLSILLTLSLKLSRDSYAATISVARSRGVEVGSDGRLVVWTVVVAVQSTVGDEAGDDEKCEHNEGKANNKSDLDDGDGVIHSKDTGPSEHEDRNEGSVPVDDTEEGVRRTGRPH